MGVGGGGGARNIWEGGHLFLVATDPSRMIQRERERQLPYKFSRCPVISRAFNPRKGSLECLSTNSLSTIGPAVEMCQIAPVSLEGQISSTSCQNVWVSQNPRRVSWRFRFSRFGPPGMVPGTWGSTALLLPGGLRDSEFRFCGVRNRALRSTHNSFEEPPIFQGWLGGSLI